MDSTLDAEKQLEAVNPRLLHTLLRENPNIAAFDLGVARWADNSATARVGSGKRRAGRVANSTHFHV